MNTLRKPHELHKSSSNYLILCTFLLAIFMGALDHGIGGLLIDKVGPKKVLLLGFIVSLIGAILLANYVNNLLTFIVTILIFGFGIGIIIGAPLNVMIMQNIPLHETGAAVGFVSLFRSLGSTIGPTIAGTILTMFNNGFTLIYMISSVFSILSLILIFSLKKRNIHEA